MWLELGLGLAGLLVWAYLYLTKDYGYFKARGITEDPATFPFGSDVAWKSITGKGRAGEAVPTVLF